MPRVFIDGTCIGGGDETVALHRDQLQMASWKNKDNIVHKSNCFGNCTYMNSVWVWFLTAYFLEKNVTSSFPCKI